MGFILLKASFYYFKIKHISCYISLLENDNKAEGYSISK